MQKNKKDYFFYCPFPVKTGQFQPPINIIVNVPFFSFLSDGLFLFFFVNYFTPMDIGQLNIKLTSYNECIIMKYYQKYHRRVYAECR